MVVVEHSQPLQSTVAMPMPVCDSRYCSATLGSWTREVSSLRCSRAPGAYAMMPGLKGVRELGSYMTNCQPSLRTMVGISRVCMSDCSCSFRFVRLAPVSISHPSASNWKQR